MQVVHRLPVLSLLFEKGSETLAEPQGRCDFTDVVEKQSIFL